MIGRVTLAPAERDSLQAKDAASTDASSKDGTKPLLGANAKGINFTTLLAAVERLHGLAACDRARAAVQGPAGNALRYGGLVVGGWYPIEWYQELWSALQAQLTLDDTGVRTLGQCAAEIGVNRVYRMFSRLASPTMLMRVAGSAFSSYFDTGNIKVRARGSNALVAEWSGCAGFNSLLWADSLGGAAYFLSATGVSNVKVNVLGGGQGEDWLIAEGIWR